MALKHKSFDGGKVIDGGISADDAYNQGQNRKEDLDRQLKTTQIRDHVRHPGKVARKSPK